MPRHEKTTATIRHFQPHKAGKGIVRLEFGGVAMSSATSLSTPSTVMPVKVISSPVKVISSPVNVISSKVTSSSGVWPLVLLLAACGGGGGGGGSSSKPVIGGSPQKPPQNPTPPVQPENSQPPQKPTPSTPPKTGQSESFSQAKGSLYDPPIIGAKVYVDVNRNRRVDDEDYPLDKNTDANGGFEGRIPIEYVNLPLISDNYGATHDGDLPPFFVAPPGSKAISPVTHIIELSVVSKSRIANHVLFTKFQPFSDNPYDTRKTHIFSNRIEEFLPELTKAIIDTTTFTRDKTSGAVTEVTTDTQALYLKVEALLKKYEKRLADLDKSVPVNSYGPLDIRPVTDLTVTENKTKLTGATRLEALNDSDKIVAQNLVEYRIAGGIEDDFLKVSDDGIISIKKAPDYEHPQPLRFTVEVRWVKYGQGVDANWQGAHQISITVKDVDEAPTGFTLSKASSSLDENVDTSARIKLADLTVTDPDTKNSDFRQHSFSLSDTDRFEIIGGALYLKANAALDHEDAASHEVTVTLLADGTNLTQTFTLNVGDVDEAPTGFTLSTASSDLDENTDITERIKLADLTVTDPDTKNAAFRQHSFSLSGDDQALFEIIGGALYLKADVALDHEGAASHKVTVTLKDGEKDDKKDDEKDDEKELTQKFTLNVNDVDEAPSGMTVTAIESELSEKHDVSGGVKVAEIEFTDDVLGTNRVTIGASDIFEIRNGGELWIKAGAVLSPKRYNVTLSPDVTGEGKAPDPVTFEFTVTNVPEAPRLVVTEDPDYRLMETPSSTEMATGFLVSATDPDPDETVSFDVTDDRFEVRKDGKLLVKAGQKFDYERETEVTLTIMATDSSADGRKVSKQVTVQIGNLNDTPLTWGKLPNVSLAEGQTDTGLVVETATKADQAGQKATHEIVGAAMQAIFEIVDGRLQFKQAPDVDADDAVNSYEVTIKAISLPVAVGDQTQSKTQTVTITITDIVDEKLSLERDTNLKADADSGLTQIQDGAVTVKEDTPDATVLYRVKAPTPDVAGNNIYFYLGGDDAGRFTINAAGELRLRAKADHETPHDKGKDNIYDVTIHAREVEDEVLHHNLDEHPDGAGAKVTDASHAVKVTIEDVNDEAPVFAGGASKTIDVSENVTAHNHASKRVNATDVVMRAQATKDDVGPDIVWSLKGDDAASFGINSDGEVWFRESPNYESNKKSYNFTIVATSGDQSAEQDVTVDIEDVDEAPSEMKVETILSSLPERSKLDPYKGIKVAEISFTDDALGQNSLVQPQLDSAFSYILNDGVYELWLNGNTDLSSPTTYSVTITPDVTGEGKAPDPVTFEFTVTNEPDSPRLVVVTEDKTYKLMETPNSTETPTGVIVSATDPDPDETVSFDVTDDRFEVRKDGKLLVKAGQKFDYERETEVTLTIMATDSSADGRKVSKQVTLQIGNDLTEKPFADVKVDGKNVAVGEKNYNIEIERTGYWEVYNQDGGNELTLKIGFGDGGQIVVARLVRDDAHSPYRLDTSAGAPTLDKKFAGDYGYFQITQLTNKDVTVGESIAHLKWKYVLFGELGTGAPVNRLKPGEEATEQINFITQSDASETKRDEKDITFEFEGKNDPPFFVEADPEAQSATDEFPVKKPSDGAFPNWSWWEKGNIVQLKANSKTKDITVDRSDGLIWRFVPVDVDGDYFQSPEDGTTRDYGDILKFIKKHIRFGTESDPDQLLKKHDYFRVVQAKDAEGNSRFITMPDGKGKLPILDLRLRLNLPDHEIPEQSFTLILRQSVSKNDENEARVKFVISPIAAREIDPLVIVGGEAVSVRFNENVPANPSRSERGEAILIYDANATKDQTAPDIVWSLKEGDDAASFGINSDGEVWFIQSPNYESNKTSYNFTIVATSGDQLAEQDVTVQINNLNDTPLTWDPLGSVSVAEGQTDTGLVLNNKEIEAKKTDEAGQKVTYEIVDAAMQAIFEIVDYRLRFKQAPDFDDATANSYKVKIRAISLPMQEGGGIQTETQRVKVKVTNKLDEALTLKAITDLTVNENSIELSGTTQLRVTTREKGDYEVEYRLAGGGRHDYVTVREDGVISLHTAPNYEEVTPHNITFNVEARYKQDGQGADDGWQGKQSFTLTVNDMPEAPVIEIKKSDKLASIFSGITTKKIDTGYRLSATDEDGDDFYFRAGEDSRFVIRNDDNNDDNKVWIRKGQIFDHKKEPKIELMVKAIDKSTSKMVGTKIITFEVLEPPADQYVFEYLRINSTAPTKVEEETNGNVTEPGEAKVIYKATAQFKIRSKVDKWEFFGGVIEWSLDGPHMQYFNISDKGEIWFVKRPDFETGLIHQYNFQVVATAGNGTQSARQKVTIDIEDVDEKPSEMMVTVLDRIPSDSISLAEAIKVADISFKDDAIGINDIGIDRNDVFEIHRIDRTSFELWVKAGAQPALPDVRVTITPNTTGSGDQLSQQKFTLSGFNVKPEIKLTMVDLDTDVRAASRLSDDNILLDDPSDGDLSASGRFLISDANDYDVAAELSLSVVVNGDLSTRHIINRDALITNTLNDNKGDAIRGKFGTLFMKADGSWTYELDKNDIDVRKLAHGQKVKDIFNITVTDSGGFTDTETLSINVTGGHEKPFRDPANAIEEYKIKYEELYSSGTSPIKFIPYKELASDQGTTLRDKTLRDLIIKSINFTHIAGERVTLDDMLLWMPRVGYPRTEFGTGNPTEMLPISQFIGEEIPSHYFRDGETSFGFPPTGDTGDLIKNTNTIITVTYKLVDKFGLESKDYQLKFNIITTADVNGSAAGKNVLRGGSHDDLFLVDSVVSNHAGADIIRLFNARGEDKIRIDGVARERIGIKAVDVDKDGNIDTVIFDRGADGTQNSENGALAVIDDYAGGLHFEYPTEANTAILDADSRPFVVDESTERLGKWTYGDQFNDLSLPDLKAIKLNGTSATGTNNDDVFLYGGILGDHTIFQKFYFFRQYGQDVIENVGNQKIYVRREDLEVNRTANGKTDTVVYADKEAEKIMFVLLDYADPLTMDDFIGIKPTEIIEIV